MCPRLYLLDLLLQSRDRAPRWWRYRGAYSGWNVEGEISPGTTVVYSFEGVQCLLRSGAGSGVAWSGVGEGQGSGGVGARRK